MDRRCCCGAFVAVLLVCVLLSSCHGGSATPPLTITTTTLPAGKVNTPYYVTLTETGGTAPYTWSQTSGGAMPAGITLSNAGVFTGTPTAAGTFGPYTLQVTDSSSDMATISLSLTINSSTLAVTTTSLPGGTVGTAYSVTLAASGGNSPYNWSQSSGGTLPPGLGTITSGGVISGTPTTPGTYGPYVFTVTDASNTAATSATMTITISDTGVAACPAQQNEAALTVATPYAFLLKGTDQNGSPIDIAGSFTPNGQGGITNAAVDYNGFTNGPEELQVNTAKSSYSFDSAGQGCLYLVFSGYVTSQPSIKHQTEAPYKPANMGRVRRVAKPEISSSVVPNVLFNFDLSGLSGGVYQTGRIIESDYASTKTYTSGFVHVQTPGDFALTSLQANYAFGVDGWTATTSTGVLRTALAGSFTNSSGTLSLGYADLNSGGSATGELTGATGDLNTTVDPNSGRGTGTLFFTIPSTPPKQVTFDFAFYILNGSDVILLSTDMQNGTTSPLFAGRALASSATYASGPLNGYYLLASQGLVSAGTSVGNLAEIGTLNATSSGTIPTATIYSNTAGTYATNPYPNSSYTVEAASGRTSFTGLTATPPVVYLTASGADDEIAGFLVGTDTDASSGVLVNQSTSAPAYTNSSVSGYWAVSTAEDVDGLNGAYLGAFTFSGTGTYDFVSQTAGTVPNAPNLGTISVNADGSGSLDGGNFPFVTNGQSLFAIPGSGDPLLFIFTVGSL
jgi:hypothetical protein